MQPGQQIEHDPEEIRKYMNWIYGTSGMINHTVDDWVANGQGSKKSGRRKSKSSKSNINDSFSNASYGQDDWLVSPGTPKRTGYRSR